MRFALPKFLAPRPPRQPSRLASLHAEIAALGAVFGAAPNPLPAGEAECARFAMPEPEGTAKFIGVALHLQVLSDGVTVRLVAPDGEILDHLYCPMRAAPYILAPFGRPAAGTTLRIGHITPRSEVLVSEALTFSLASGRAQPGACFSRRRADRLRRLAPKSFRRTRRRRRAGAAAGPALSRPRTAHGRALASAA